MKLGKPLAALMAGALAFGLAGCGSGGTTSTPTTTAAGTQTATASAPVTLTMSGWSLKTTPEFQTLVDAYKKVAPNVTITLKEYDPNTYEQLMLTDMTGGQAPDIITIKQAKYTWQWATGNALMDVSDVVAGLSKDVTGAASYAVNGKNYGVPYRQDSWLLFYNKDLFDAAGVAVPDGKWTWDTYASTAKDLTTKLAAAGKTALGTYEHSWQSTLQGFANAQKGDNTNPAGPYMTGNYTYMQPYYDRALDLQNSGAQVAYGDISTNKLTYQAQFGKQSTAMMLMGSWYIATLVSQQTSGDADKFTWGMAPAPQVDSSTVSTPVTFGDPTGMGINAKIDPSKLQAAKDFLAFVASEDAAKALAGIGITPSTSSDAVTAAVFATAGMPSDALSKTAYQVHKTMPENPSGADVMNISTVLGAAHTAIMSGSADATSELATASQKVKDKDW
ncbi:MAG: extracellular solute-binding protein [Propionibacteriaceae bacterium]|jgi:multiple sugar transport system substrate-binding protein|nr:extracellular solute-binding protein [Propionibacteriaceae bacterium]